MAKKRFYVSLTLMLLVNILFIQGGLNFFHSEDCHKSEKRPNEMGLSIELPSEDCAVCELELFHELFFAGNSPLTFFVSFEDVYCPFFITADFSFFYAAAGRAPPVC